MAIYAKVRDPKNLRDLLKQLFSIFIDDDVSIIETFYDKEFTRSQCQAGRWRSFDDLLEICETYFPKTTAKELFATLLNLDIHDQYDRQCNLIMMHCEGIDRINMIYSADYVKYSEAISLNQYDSEYSWKDLFNEVGITSDKELKQFILNKI